MTVQLKVPEVGESITEALIAAWLKAEGEHVERDEPVAEIESDKATVQVFAPASGTLGKIVKPKGETVKIGEVIGSLEEAGETVTVRRAAAVRARGERVESKPVEAERAAGVAPAPDRAASVVPASEPAASAPPAAALPAEIAGERPAAPRPTTGLPREEEVVPMTPMRRRIAERLVEAKNTAALLTTFNEFDMSAVSALRQKHREAFLNKYGVKLGLMPFFVKAAIEALKLIPQLNAEVRGDQIVYRNYHDIGIAVGGGKGLVVPVLRNAERMSFAELERAIEDFAKRGEENKIKLEELQGGTFTITNGGIYGSLLATPIVNPPQSGVLGLHAIQDRPVARDNQVVIRPMMYSALTYDHRIVDGREAVVFLRRIKEIIEEPARMLLEV
jgi:2-oxoglutarate dehydrogenase E2 component (dihydrolipoamide succinyltransferase)